MGITILRKRTTTLCQTLKFNNDLCDLSLRAETDLVLCNRCCSYMKFMQIFVFTSETKPPAFRFYLRLRSVTPPYARRSSPLANTYRHTYSYSVACIRGINGIRMLLGFLLIILVLLLSPIRPPTFTLVPRATCEKIQKKKTCSYIYIFRASSSMRRLRCHDDVGIKNFWSDCAERGAMPRHSKVSGYESKSVFFFFFFRFLPWTLDDFVDRKPCKAQKREYGAEDLNLFVPKGQAQV